MHDFKFLGQLSQLLILLLVQLRRPLKFYSVRLLLFRLQSFTLILLLTFYHDALVNTVTNLFYIALIHCDIKAAAITARSRIL